MRLKSLEVVGFKSFLEPTTICFAPGVTAVVGPNGCGKSNVVDAIRWVLGEQAPTRLRGKTTEDLIYAGNDSNPAAGMAEVSLTLEAVEENRFPEPYAALSEVQVTRRVYRSGESEYLLNKIPCRLKDIAEFFMAVQIHSRGYALIEQGKIEEIIQAKPAELRTLVEEAAGLSLFKGRREISERKLERVKENLARLGDVLAEIERQLAFARRQAKKAEAYRQIKLELGELEMLTAARRLLDQRAELKNWSGREAELKDAAENARQEATGLQAEVERAAAELQSMRDALAAVSQELENLRAAAAERARTRAFIERRLATLDELEPTLVARAGELESRATAARAARADTGARLARETNQESGAEGELGRLRQEYDAAVAALEEAEASAEQTKDLISDLMGEAGTIRGRLGDLAGEHAELEQRIAAGDSLGPGLTAALEAAAAELAQAQAELERCRAGVAASESVCALAAEKEAQARAALDHLGAQLEAAREIEAAASGHSRPALAGDAGERLAAVLESLNGDRPSSPPALLSDIVSAPGELEPALHAVLGEQLGGVIVDSPHFALRAVEVLKQNRSGRLSFIPESMAASAHPPVAAPGISGRLVDKLAVEPRFGPLVEAMLGHVLLAEDLPAALNASNLNGYGTVFVTREGDVIWPGGIISGGSADGLASAPSSEPAQSAEQARAEASRRESDYRSAEQRLEEERAAHERAEAALRATRESAAGAEDALGPRRAALAQAEQQLAVAGAHRDDALRRLAEIEALAPASNSRLEEIARNEQRQRAILSGLKNEIAGRKAASDKLGEAMLKCAARVESRKAGLAALEQEWRHANSLADELEAQIDENRRTLQRSRAERIDFQGELEKFHEQDQAAGSREAEISGQLTELKRLSESSAAALERRREALRCARETLAALEGEAVESGLRRERARALSEELTRNFAEKFSSDFDTVASRIEAALSGRDATADLRRLGELRARAERIGEVNLAAESEVKELEERAAALGAQRTDLEAAVRDLTQTIHKLNREARRRFAETFEAAARNFADLLPKLMRGARGRLELAAPDDLLESGVNIMVQPAGKKVREIGLLSGGEKALSAMALVFSLFLLNPSPFCVLDEVDAPLDEFSIAAFTGLISELKRRSQFIVITHNQRTMQMADQIHGVTMEQPGISRLISLKLSEPAAARAA